MSEEADEKVRRNLVIASSLVLAAAWLELPMGSVADRLLGAKLDCSAQVQAWRVWAAVLAVLAYLTHRYRFSESTADSLADFRNAWKTGRRRMASKLVVARIMRHLLKKTDHHLFDDSARPLNLHGNGASTDRLLRLLDRTKASWHVTFESDPHAWWLGHLTIGTGGQQVAFQGRVILRSLDQKLVLFRAAWRLLGYSASSGELIIPILLAAAAWATAVVHLLTALMN